MKKILTVLITLILSQTLMIKVLAGSDGDLEIKNKKTEQRIGVKDCFETVNRSIFAFNQGLDKIFFKPIAKGYRYLPKPIRSGTGNALGNLSNVVTIPNNILQGDFSKAGINTGRFIINSTVGILGLVDVATMLGFEEYNKEDYGQTLAAHGVGPGCYIVLPVLGPSTARDSVAMVTNYVGGDAWYNVTVSNDTQYFSDFDYYASKVTSGVDFRAKNYDSIENLEKNSLDFYASVKSLYLQDRQQKILNTTKIIDTQDDSDWEEIESQ